MIEALLVSNGILWLLVIGLALTVLALTRQKSAAAGTKQIKI